ncbi:MAG: transcriptional repressor NrdR [Clostridia bacterium]|nr:transcriptional repressor NrdR [Clostridia bacterium]
MKCIYCGCVESRVIDSRSTDDGASIRRRRECERCGKRFTTYEKVDSVPLMVVKKDKRRQPFDLEKLREGIIKACEKRPVSMEAINELTRTIEMKAYASDQEITSAQLGEMVMEGLKPLDEVAYIRFASVYRQFKDIETFMAELNSLLSSR